MLNKSINIFENSNLIQSLIFAFFGIILGLFLMKVIALSSKWAISFSILMAIPFLALVLGDIKNIFFALLILSLPLKADLTFFYRPHIGGADAVNISITDLLLFVLYTFWFIEIYVNREASIHFFPKTTIPILFFILVCVLSMIKSENIALSIFEIVTLTKMFLVYFYIANNVNEKNARYIVMFLLLGVFLQSILALCQYLFNTSFGLAALGEREEILIQQVGSQTTSRIAGTFGNPNALAKYIELMLPLGISTLFVNHNIKEKSFYFVTVIAGIFTLILTLSRGAWIGFTVSVLIILFFTSKEKAFRLRKFLIIIFMLLILCAAIISYSELITSRFLSDDSGSAKSRLYLMQTAFSIIKSNPFLGIGINNYTVVSQYYDSTGMWFIFPHPVHNVYLLIASEIGILGLIIFIWLVISIYKECYLLISRNSLLSNIGIGITAGLTAILIHWLVGWEYISSNNPFWFLAGFIVAMNKIKQNNT